MFAVIHNFTNELDGEFLLLVDCAAQLVQLTTTQRG